MTNRKIFRARSKALAPLAKRLIVQAANNACSVLPAAIPSVVATVPWIVMFTRKAPRKTPGQSFQPHRRNAASAMPLGGQTADTLACRYAHDKPSLPAQK